MSVSTEFSTKASKKSQRTDLGKDRDRLSNLSESVMCHILSRLTAKEAVRTCVLSKTWERKWTIIYNFNIVDNELYQKKGSSFLKLSSTKSNFFNFVERLLLASQNAKTFRLLCFEKHESSRVTSWIRTILRRQVENLDVMYAHEGVSLPPQVLSCTSLRTLELKLHCTLKVPLENSLPRLTTLYLKNVEMHNENPEVDTLRFTFPILETLTLLGCTWLNLKLVDIYAPKLTTFKCRSSLNAKVNDYTIKVTAERVVQFVSSGGVPENLILNALQFRVVSLKNNFNTSDIQLLEQMGTQVRELMKGLSSSRGLGISGSWAKAIAYSNRDVSLPVCPMLQALIVLSQANSEALVALLDIAVYLKHLTLNVISWDDYDYDQVKPLPNSLVLHLETVKLKNFTGTTAQLNLAKFLLKSGTKLKQVHLLSGEGSYYSGSEKETIVKQLSASPTCSSCLMVIVA